MENQSRRKPLMIISLFLLATLLIAFTANYIIFVSGARDREAASQLSEVYGQVNTQFTDLANKNWNLLIDGALTVRIADENTIDEYIESMKQQWNFDDWLFINSNGKFVSTSGKSGYLNLGSDLDLLMKENENIVVDGSLTDSDPVMIYAVPTEVGSYKDFEFHSVALVYDKQSMVDIMETTSYGGEGRCYLIYPDGRLLMAMQDNESMRIAKNMYTMLKTVKFKMSDYDTVYENIQNGKSDVCRYIFNGSDCYMYYSPVGFQDWVMVGIVPANLVGQHITEVMERTTLLTAGCSVLLVAAFVIIILERNRRSISIKNDELAFRDSLFEILAGATSNIYMVVEPEGNKVEYLTSNTKRVLGISLEEVQRDMNVFFKNQDSEQLKELFERLSHLNFGEMMSTEVIRTNPETGQKYYYTDLIYHVQIGDSRRYIFAMLDHTEDRANKEALKQALEIANTANESKSSFLSSMSHDIRTPMNAIVGFPPLLDKDAENPEKVREYSAKIRAAGQHLLGIINDILDMSKIESGKVSLNNAEFSLSAVIDELTTIIQPQAHAKNQTFEVITRDMRNEFLEGDHIKLSQILMNVLSNAVKYTPPGGRIIMTIMQLRQTATNIANFRFIISDNGIGMSEEFQKTLFEPFTREENSSTNQANGSGLGMAIVKSLVDIMGGYISVNSRQGEGSTFTIELRFKIHRDETYDDFWQKQQLNRALIVDRSPETCLAIVDTAGLGGLTMEYTTEPENALSMVREAFSSKQPYNLVMLDGDDPTGECIKAAAEISQTTNPPLLLLRTKDRSAVEIKLGSARVDGFLNKPFFLSYLKEAIERIRAPKLEKTNSLPLNGLNVLAAEDYELNAEILRATLEMNGAACEICSDGKKVVERFEKSSPHEFDLILMDIQMPVMNGHEATEAIRRSSHPDARDIPIIAMSANAFAEDMQRAFEAGMSDYLTKPVDVNAMVHTISRVLEK